MKPMWYLSFWNGEPGYYDSIFVSRYFDTANEAIAYAEIHCVRKKFYLKKVVF